MAWAERLEVSMAESGNIYEKKVTTKVAQPLFSTEELVNNQFDNSDQLKRKAAQEKSNALSTYSQNMNSLATQNMTKAFSAFGYDPKALSVELEKLKTNMMKEMPEPEIRANFSANYELQSSSYINKAQANFDKIQYEKRKSAIFNSIMNNDKAVGLSFSNALNGTASPDDYVNYKKALQDNRSLIEARNDDGTYMFSDNQRYTMTKNVNKQVMDNFLGTLSDMPEYKRKDFMSKLAKDEVVLMNIENSTGVHPVKLQDTVDPAMYRDMKRKAEELRFKERKQVVAEFNLMRNEATMNFLKDPTEQGLEELKKLYPEVGENKIKAWENAVNSRLNGEAITSFDSYADAMSAYKDIANMTADNPEETVALMNKVDDFMLAARDSNANGKISVDDLDNINSDVQKMLNDKVFQEQMKNLPDISIFTRIGQSYQRFTETNTGGKLSDFGEALADPERRAKVADYTKIDKSNIPMDTTIKADNRGAISKAADKVAGVVRPLLSSSRNYSEDELWYRKQGLKTMKDMLNVMRQGGEIEVNGRKVTAQDVYNKGVQEAIRYKYRFIPEMQGELVAGETVINLNGLNYVFQGYNQRDILIEEAN